MTSSRPSSFARSACVLGAALLGTSARAQEDERVGTRAPFPDVQSAARTLAEASTSRDERREAAVELLFRFGSEGIERVALALQGVVALPLDRELLGTVEGQILEALRDAIEARAAGGMDLDPAMMRLTPHLVRLAARREGTRGRMRSDAAVRSLLALLESNLEREIRRAFASFLKPATELELRRAMLVALPRLRQIELAPAVAAVAFENGENAALRRLAQAALVGLVQRGFFSMEEFLSWSESEAASSLASRERAGELAWAAGERLRAELLAAREKLVTHAGNDLELLLELLGDPTFPRVRAGSARELAHVVARFQPERDAEALRRVMSGLVRGVRQELHPEVLVELAICLRNLAPLVGAAERSAARASADAEVLSRCEQFRLHIKPLRELLIDLAPAGKVAERSLWAVRARAVEALRWFPADALVQSHVAELLEKALEAPADADFERGEEYSDYRRALFRTAAEIDFAGPPAARALVQIRRLAADPEIELRRSALPLLRALGANAAVGASVRERLLAFAREESDPGVRAELLDVLAQVAEAVPEFLVPALDRHVDALGDEERVVRELAAEWFVRALRAPQWSALAAARFGEVLERRLHSEGERDPRVRAALARAALEGLRADWLRISLAHLSDAELRAAASRMRDGLEERPPEAAVLLSLATALGERLPEAAYSMLLPDPRDLRSAWPASLGEARDRQLLLLGWAAFARLERFEVFPPQLSDAQRERIEALLDRANAWDATEDELFARADLELRVGRSERVLLEFPSLLQRAPAGQLEALLDRLIWANWVVLRWAEVSHYAAQREREGKRRPSWCVAAMIFEARVAGERSAGRASIVELVREAQRVIADDAAGSAEALLVLRRTLGLVDAFQRQELEEGARALLDALPALPPLPPSLERDLGIARARYR
ncbi:MAG: hypothetical protein JNM84_25390 [Planctomycetes bacterium]|nr:hypothetical protein [Planctomycetota bacterium]